MEMKTGTRFLPARPALRRVTTGALMLALSSTMVPTPGQACSSFALDNAATVYGTNYDSYKDLCLIFVNTRGQRKTGFSAGLDGRTARWISRYASVTFNVGGYQLPWAGMNEQGLMLSTMALDETMPPLPDERTPLDYGSLWMQYVLDTCATVEEVIATDSVVRLVTCQDHYLVADRDGGAAVIEFLDGEMVVHRGNELPIKALANDPYAESLATWNQFLDSGGTDCDEISGYHQRFCHMAQRTSAFEPANSASAVAFAFDTLEIVSQSSTQFSIVFDPGSFRVYYRTLLNPEIRYIDLYDFDLNCPQPVQMAEIHSLTSGAVSDQFFDLSLEMCRDHLFAYLELSEVDVPAELVEELFAVTASFTCNRTRRASRRIGIR